MGTVIRPERDCSFNSNESWRRDYMQRRATCHSVNIKLASSLASGPAPGQSAALPQVLFPSLTDAVIIFLLTICDYWCDVLFLSLVLDRN